MATGKRYYWIKLKDSFMSSDMIDYLMGQPDVPTMLSFIKCSVSKPSTLAADWLSKSGI